jgi:creatinine amidohydrolase
VVDIVCRRLRGDGAFAVSCMASHMGMPPGIVLSREEQCYGIHGGLVETSLMLHLRPDLARMARAIDFRSAWLAKEGTVSMLTPEGGVGFGWETQDLHPAGALGDASAATATMGAAILEYQAGRLATLLEEVRRFDVDAWMGSVPAPNG